MNSPTSRRFLALTTAFAFAVAIPFGAGSSAAASHAGNGAKSALLKEALPSVRSLTSSQAALLSRDASQKVIVILRNQYSGLTQTGSQSSRRTDAITNYQAPVLHELRAVSAQQVRPFHIINAIAATVSKAEAAHLRSDQAVRAVVPDRMIPLPKLPSLDMTPIHTSKLHADSTIPKCGFKSELDPEALQVIHAAYKNHATPQAQNYENGAGVTVAFMADGVDVNNPDLVRANGQPVVRQVDFSGDPANYPTAGGEAFLDASSIAAQGNETYNLNDQRAPIFRSSKPCPQIKVLGVAPGANVISLKVFGIYGAETENFVQAIQWAVDHHVNVVNQSFGSNPYPDNVNDPISMANDAAVKAGTTIVASSGDAGSTSTLGAPGTDPHIITAGATTTFRAYSQINYPALLPAEKPGQYVSNNISSLSSGGISQSGQKTVDVVAPGDLNWALCTPSPLYPRLLL